MRSRIGWRSRLSRMRGSTVQFDLGRYDAPLAEIARVEGELGGLTDSDLLRQTKALHDTVRQGATPASVRNEWFAIARETSRRALGQRPFDEQVVAALAIDQGHVVDMQTGEGKTLAAVMPAAWNALGGKGVHVPDVQRLSREARCRVDGTDLPSARIVRRLRAGGDERGGTARCIPC